MTEVLNSYETFISTSTQNSLNKMNSTRGVNFWQFCCPQRLRHIKKLNDRSPKILRNIYFNFCTIVFDSNHLYKSCQFLTVLPSPGIMKRFNDRSPNSVKITIFTFAHSSLIKGIFQKSSFFWHLLHLRRLKQMKGSLIEVLNSSKIFFYICTILFDSNEL